MERSDVCRASRPFPEHQRITCFLSIDQYTIYVFDILIPSIYDKGTVAGSHKKGVFFDYESSAITFALEN